MILTKSDTKQINLDIEITGKINSECLDELLIIVPTNRKARSLTKEIISASKLKSTGKINVDTLTTFSENILKNLKNFIPLSEAVSTVLINRTLQC